MPSRHTARRSAMLALPFLTVGGLIVAANQNDPPPPPETITITPGQSVSLGFTDVTGPIGTPIYVRSFPFAPGSVCDVSVDVDNNTSIRADTALMVGPIRVGGIEARLGSYTVPGGSFTVDDSGTVAVSAIPGTRSNPRQFPTDQQGRFSGDATLEITCTPPTTVTVPPTTSPSTSSSVPDGSSSTSTSAPPPPTTSSSTSLPSSDSTTTSAPPSNTTPTTSTPEHTPTTTSSTVPGPPPSPDSPPTASVPPSVDRGDDNCPDGYIDLDPSTPDCDRAAVTESG